MAAVSAYTKSLVVGVALFLAFRYGCSFPLAQSCVLAGVAWLGYALYVDVRARVREDSAFSPFWVVVSPNWDVLLLDHNLIKDDKEEWRALGAKMDSAPISEYRVLRDGIVFTVLKPEPFGGLIYWNNRQMFRSEVNFEERIEEIKAPSPKRGWKSDWSPGVYFKWGRGGYELGLEVNAGWWEETCAEDETKQLAKIKADPQHLTGTVRLAIATLPYSEFAIYAEGNAPAPWYGAAMLKGRDAELAKAGWKREEKDAELDLLGAPDCVKHKYFTVSHRAI